jgi:hypothetical protein
MNERIKELAEQAVRYALDKANEGEDEDYEYSFDDDFHEKFAELLVRECMRMCDTAQMGYLTHGLEKEASGAISVKQYIEEHFGVEE